MSQTIKYTYILIIMLTKNLRLAVFLSIIKREKKSSRSNMTMRFLQALFSVIFSTTIYNLIREDNICRWIKAALAFFQILRPIGGAGF